ncbi:hypothetical protein ACG33_01380 [Steroidobacter denitrificans]|uniref:Co-chaperone DjlA N-terminal domain-containing protein n=1 Tax=Steroidobacter denitrificans TaxID=465721 RepID=A0A127F838_STEDE|nr:hypothetical protein ACG33_01380 [Steroidobacter denitrificans]
MERVLEGREPPELTIAALLVELTRSDFTTSQVELDEVRRLLMERFGLEETAVQALVADASARADRAVSLHEFTHRLNRELADSDKLEMIEMLWRVSLADGHLDKHEEQLIKRIAGLLHVSDRDRVRLKLKVLEGQA